MNFKNMLFSVNVHVPITQSKKFMNLIHAITQAQQRRFLLHTFILYHRVLVNKALLPIMLVEQDIFSTYLFNNATSERGNFPCGKRIVELDKQGFEFFHRTNLDKLFKQ